MSYAAYSQISKGYAPYAVPASVQDAAVLPVPAHVAAEGKEGTFEELLVTEGVGDYHINHFIGYGSYLALKSPEKIVRLLNQALYLGFVDVFEPNEAAAEKGDYLFNGVDTIEFTVGGKRGDLFEKAGGLFHSDWVSMQMSADGESFYASTLKRRWMTTSEKVLLLAQNDAKDLIETNQHHFLAGRRSFKIGYDQDLKRLYIETAAFERSSLCEYNVLEKTGLLRDAIVAIWTNLIENFEKTWGKWISPSLLPKPHQAVRQGYSRKGNVDYRQGRHKKAAQALNTPWFAKVLARNPGLTKGVPL